MDENICIGCGKPFSLTQGEMEFYRGMIDKDPNFVMPKRCAECRAKKKRERMNESRESRRPRFDDRDRGYGNY